MNFSTAKLFISFFSIALPLEFFPPFPKLDWALVDGRIYEARERLSAEHRYGQGAKVMIIDSGISPDVSELQDMIRECRQFTPDATDPHICEDLNNHGTLVSSVITSRGHDVKGIAPKADLYIADVAISNPTDYQNPDWEPSIRALERAFTWALELEVDVISISLKYTETIMGPLDYQKLVDRVGPLIEQLIQKPQKGVPDCLDQILDKL